MKPKPRGGYARAKKLSPQRRKQIAQQAANTRWIEYRTMQPEKTNKMKQYRKKIKEQQDKKDLVDIQYRLTQLREEMDKEKKARIEARQEYIDKEIPRVKTLSNPELLNSVVSYNNYDNDWRDEITYNLSIKELNIRLKDWLGGEELYCEEVKADDGRF